MERVQDRDRDQDQWLAAGRLETVAVIEVAGSNSKAGGQAKGYWRWISVYQILGL